MSHLRRWYSWIKAHKVHSFLLFLFVMLVFWRYSASDNSLGSTRYILAATEKGTVISSVSGTGQVLATDQVSIKTKVGGDVLALSAVQGQEVYAGQALIQLDAVDARKAVRDAEANLESAELSLAKLRQSSANISSLMEDAFADISNAFLDFPGVMNTAQDIILGSTLNPRNQDNAGYYRDFVGVLDDREYQRVNLFIDSALADYAVARREYDDALLLYKNTTRYSGHEEVSLLLEKTLVTSRAIAQALKSEQNLLDYLSDYSAERLKTLPSLITSYKASLRTNIGLVNGHLSGLSGISSEISNAPLDVRAQELAVAQRKNSLIDARGLLADYIIRAPFSGILAELSVRKGDSVSSGAAVATVITTQKIAEISLNEVDIARVAIGQKATLTFDALPGSTAVGTVTQIDTIGVASQGVVTYTVQISFDGAGGVVKPGMSVSAAIITDVRQDVLTIPSSAIKTQGDGSYVEVLDEYIASAPEMAFTQGVVSELPPAQRPISVGLTGDSDVEVTNGLSEGEIVVIRTVTSKSGSTATSPSSGLRIPGITGGSAIRPTGR